MEYTSKQLDEHTCESFGGPNCVLHGCMFGCQLNKAKQETIYPCQKFQFPDSDMTFVFLRHYTLSGVSCIDYYDECTPSRIFTQYGMLVSELKRVI